MVGGRLVDSAGWVALGLAEEIGSSVGWEVQGLVVESFDMLDECHSGELALRPLTEVSRKTVCTEYRPSSRLETPVVESCHLGVKGAAEDCWSDSKSLGAH